MAFLRDAVRWALLAASLSCAGCDYFTFDVSEGEAAVRVVAPSGAFGVSGFGQVVTGYGFEDDTGTWQGRFAVGAGIGTPLAVYALWRGDALGALEKPMFEACQAEQDVSCGAEAGAALIGVPAWVGGSGNLQRGCVLTTSPEDGDHVFVCENAWSQYQPVRVAPGVRAGESAAPLPASVREHFGVALLGAPDQGPRGNLVLLRGAARDGSRLLWDDTEVPLAVDGAELGAAVDVAESADGRVIFAAGAPGAERVLVGALVDGAAGETVEVLGCLGPEESAPGFGGVVELGDFDGDGSLDLAASASAQESDRLQRVWRWRLGGLSGAAGCVAGGAPASPPDQVISCDGLEPVEGSLSLLCEGALFGAALASGDLNGDGREELFVGAPGAEVDGVSGAGVVVVLGAEGGSLRLDAAHILHDSSPEADGALGSSLAAVPTAAGAGARSELVTGAPGANRVFVFLCSGMAGDRPREQDGTDRCLGR